MNKKVLVRFVPPAAVNVPIGKGVTHDRTWKVDKLIGFLQEGLELAAAEAHPDLELRVVEARASEIRFESWKPDKPGELREQIGQMIGSVMDELEVEEYLND